jgi:hypothetical protein
MKISTVSSPANTVSAQADSQVSRVETLRNMKMNTRATPLTASDLPPPGVEPEEKLSNLDTTEGENAKSDEVTQPLSPQYAELARKRRALQVKERELAEKEKALMDKGQDGSYVSMAELKSQPIKVLLENGLTWEQLTDHVVNYQGNSQAYDFENKFKNLEKTIEEKFSNQEKQAEQQTLALMRKDAESLVAEGDTFELIRETKSVPDVMRLIERTYRESGEVLDVSEACQLVEDELFKEAEKLASLKKIQSKFQPPAPESQPQSRQQPIIRTLSNKHTASIPMDKKQRALAAFYGNLKK